MFYEDKKATVWMNQAEAEGSENELHSLLF